MTMGFSFGNVKLYRLRKYYLKWIHATLQSARMLNITPRDRYLILQMEEKLKMLVVAGAK